MVKTIQVSESTHKALYEIKLNRQEYSLDDVIVSLLAEHLLTEQSRSKKK